MTDDNHILPAIRENAEKGFRLLMAEYREPVYWHIRRLVVSHADAQDATQEAFIRIFRCIDQYSGEGTFRAWIFRIATNEALRLLGRNQGKTTLSLDDTVAATLTMKADDYFDYSDVEAVRLQKAITALPAKQQLAFNLRYYDDLSYREIAAITDSTEATVKANYHFAKEKIIKFMNSNEI
ncbi:MAG: RNA polymerase sigma factor [Prevotella sp.]|nr:RNA polymerase sigma factor [Prevotella sp.]MBO7130150.1 RNA polymerase sigma factor [Prevotella sp.]